MIPDVDLEQLTSAMVIRDPYLLEALATAHRVWRDARNLYVATHFIKDLLDKGLPRSEMLTWQVWEDLASESGESFEELWCHATCRRSFQLQLAPALSSHLILAMAWQSISSDYRFFHWLHCYIDGVLESSASTWSQIQQEANRLCK